MWYFSWLLGLGLALSLGIINVLWLEAFYAFGPRGEELSQLELQAKAMTQQNLKNGV